ncbi:ATP-dependent sacrificial sulfur transferase LarE [Campylobacter sputorum]|uniref:ATP-dependent sacrificial sulfur transferase LarE n=1 Tax=Campylobacter sputorum TaxID=206 RepID=UPI0030034CF4|nr:adenine nucleotide alpha hydrolase family protein [Campylobacter sputorum bv. faecalis CCUG 20703]
MNIEKLENLKQNISNLENLIVAFSGGVDSSFLSKVASDLLGKKFLAITIDTMYMSRREINEAINFAKKYKINHKIVKIKNIKSIENNPKNRCYLCKKEIFLTLLNKACELGFSNIADGTNKDDLSEYRPGLKVIKELGILSPLKEFSKLEIREFSKILNLETYNKPSSPCLLTRMPHDYKFSTIEINSIENIENLLKKSGYKEVRARFDGKDIKIEMPYNQMAVFIQDRNFKNIIKSINNFIENGQILLDLKGMRGEILF